MSRVAWAIATTIGYALGMSVASVVMGAVGRPLSGILAGLPFVLVYGALVGLVVAVAQLVGVPAARRFEWIVANVVGNALGLTALAVVGEWLGNTIDPLLPLVIGEGAIEDLSGATLGIVVALFQWPVLRAALPRRRWWVIATAVGAGLSYGTAAGLLELFEIPVLKANLVPVFAAIVGLFIGIAQAIALPRRARA